MAKSKWHVGSKLHAKWKKIKHCDAALDCDAVRGGTEHCLSCGHFNG